MYACIAIGTVQLIGYAMRVQFCVLLHPLENMYEAHIMCRACARLWHEWDV